MGSIENTRNIWHYIQKHQKASITKIASDMNLHFYQTKSIVELLHDLGIIELVEMGGARYAQMKGADQSG